MSVLLERFEQKRCVRGNRSGHARVFSPIVDRSAFIQASQRLETKENSTLDTIDKLAKVVRLLARRARVAFGEERCVHVDTEKPRWNRCVRDSSGRTGE